MYVVVRLRVGEYQTEDYSISVLALPRKSNIYFQMFIYGTFIRKHMDMEHDPENDKQSIAIWNRLLTDVYESLI